MVSNTTAVTVEVFIGNFSIDGSSGPALPKIELSEPISTEIHRQDTPVYGFGLKLEPTSWLYPAFGMRFAQQEAWIRGGHQKVSAGNSYSSVSWSSLKASLTTNFVWATFGLETNFPGREGNRRTRWRSLVFGSGGSLIYAKETTHPDSSYIVHFEQWENDFFESGQTSRHLGELTHEEMDLSNFSSSGFGIGWYFLSGFAFHLLESISLKLEVRAEFGTIDLQSRDSAVDNSLYYGGGIIGIATSYRF